MKWIKTCWNAILYLCVYECVCASVWCVSVLQCIRLLYREILNTMNCVRYFSLFSLLPFVPRFIFLSLSLGSLPSTIVLMVHIRSICAVDSSAVFGFFLSTFSLRRWRRRISRGMLFARINFIVPQNEHCASHHTDSQTHRHTRYAVWTSYGKQ